MTYLLVMAFYLIMSSRRGETFVTKITRGLARINAGLESIIYLGNLNSKEIGDMQKITLKCNG